jgi:hypothetical protein
MPNWALPALSWLVSFYFLAGFVANVGFPPARSIFGADVLYVTLWLFFLFLPFFKKVKVGSFLELEREVEKAKEEAGKAREDLQAFKTEVRNSLQILSTNVNTIGGMSNQVTVNIPGLAELQQARQVLEDKAPPDTKATAEALEKQIWWRSDDPAIALATMRIEIERILRRVLDKRTTVSDAQSAPIRFKSLSSLFSEFTKRYPDFGWLNAPFRSFINVANAAVHAQRMTDEEVKVALELGAEIVATLKKLFPTETTD